MLFIGDESGVCWETWGTEAIVAGSNIISSIFIILLVNLHNELMG